MFCLTHFGPIWLWLWRGVLMTVGTVRCFIIVLPYCVYFIYGLAYSHVLLCMEQVVHAGINIHRRSHQENCCCLGGRPCPEDFGRGWHLSTGSYVGAFPILCEESTFINGTPLHGQAEPYAQGSTTHFESIYHRFSLCIGSI